MGINNRKVSYQFRVKTSRRNDSCNFRAQIIAIATNWKNTKKYGGTVTFLLLTSYFAVCSFQEVF